MNGEKILKAMTDIDDAFITDAADDTHIKAVFKALPYEEKHTAVETRKRRNVKYILIAAIICALLIAVASFTISSDFFNFNFPEGFVTVNDDVAGLDILHEPGSAENYNETQNPVIQQLEEIGIKNPVLPTAILEEWVLNGKIRTQHEDNAILRDAKLSYKKGDKSVEILIVNYSDYDLIPDDSHNITSVDKGEYLKINGLSVLAFYRGAGSSTVEYVNGNTTYTLSFSWCTFEEVKEILETIGTPFTGKTPTEETTIIPDHSAEDDEAVISTLKQLYDCLEKKDTGGLREVISEHTLLLMDYDVKAYIDESYETINELFGTNASWEVGEITLQYYTDNQVMFTREEYTRDENTNDNFEAPVITQMCTVVHDMYINTDQGEFFEENNKMILVKENGEWKIWF